MELSGRNLQLTWKRDFYLLPSSVCTQKAHRCLLLPFPTSGLYPSSQGWRSHLAWTEGHGQPQSWPSELALLSPGDSQVCPPDPAIQHRYLLHSGRWGRGSARRFPGPRRSPPWTAGSRLCLTSSHAPSSHRSHWILNLFHVSNWSPWKRRGKACDHPPGKRGNHILISLSRDIPWHSWAVGQGGLSQLGCQSTWSLTGQHRPVREGPTREPKHLHRQLCLTTALALCQFGGAAPGDSPILPLPMPRCLNTCSDVHISTYLYTRFKKTPVLVPFTLAQVLIPLYLPPPVWVSPAQTTSYLPTVAGVPVPCLPERLYAHLGTSTSHLLGCAHTCLHSAAPAQVPRASLPPPPHLLLPAGQKAGQVEHPHRCRRRRSALPALAAARTFYRTSCCPPLAALPGTAAPGLPHGPGGAAPPARSRFPARWPSSAPRPLPREHPPAGRFLNTACPSPSPRLTPTTNLSGLFSSHCTPAWPPLCHLHF